MTVWLVFYFKLIKIYLQNSRIFEGWGNHFSTTITTHNHTLLPQQYGILCIWTCCEFRGLVDDYLMMIYLFWKHVYDKIFLLLINTYNKNQDTFWCKNMLYIPIFTKIFNYRQHKTHIHRIISLLQIWKHVDMNFESSQESWILYYVIPSS